MNFKYSEYIESLKAECPPSSYIPQERTAYRFVFQSGHPKANTSFLPVLLINPQRRLKPDTPNTRCMGYALSLFDTQENAQKRYRSLKKKNKNIGKVMGDQVARGIINKNDGLASEVDKNGHFSLHESQEANLEKKFQIVCSLIEK